MRALSLSFVLLAVCAAGCDPKIQGGAGPGPGGAGGQGGGGGQTGRQDGGDGPGFGFTVPDGGAAEVPAAGGGGGSEGSCAETLVKAQQVPVDLLVLLDNSASMDGAAGMRSKWATAQDALVAFVRDPRSAGLGVGVQFFPLPPTSRECRTDADCPTPRGPPPFPGSCRDNELCVTAGPPTTWLNCLPATSGNRCVLGGTCRSGGLCAVSGRRCPQPGMPCPGGMPGDACVAAARVCEVFGDSECAVAPYQKPAVAIGPLPGNEAALVQAITRRETDGDTPTGPALQGVYAHLGDHLAANPGRRAAVILATDGLPTACGVVQPAAIAAEIRRSQMGPPSVPTYVIGVFAATEAMMARPALEMWATAGGTGAPFVLNAAGDLGQRLQEALAQIRGSALPCEFTIPPSTGAGPIDFARVNVKLQSGGAAPETIPHVPGADRCDPMRGGWYYDVDPASAPGARPTRIIVCPATCGRFKAAQHPSVSLAFGCKTEVIQ